MSDAVEVDPAPATEDPDNARYTSPREGKLRTGDAARRMRDVIRLHQLALSREEIIARRFVVIALSDGRSDGQVYDTRADAMRLQKVTVHVDHAAYIQIPLERLDEYACDSMLHYVRTAYSNGYRPTHGRSLALPRKPAP